MLSGLSVQTVRKILLLGAMAFILAFASKSVVAQETEDLQIQALPSFQEGEDTKAERLRSMSSLYRLQADILDAELQQRLSRFETLLDSAYVGLGVLMEDSLMRQDQRFRELYRSIMVEYQNYYSTTDTLMLAEGEINQVRELGLAAVENNAPEAKPIDLPKLDPISTEVPMVVNRTVESFASYLLAKSEDTVDLWRPRADKYFPMIEKIFAEEGAPDELKYLALIESGLKPDAQSWAKAGGMWQFIVPTGSAYGLKKNHWVDERMDPEKATRAAARHLKDLYVMFDKNWHFALAGYNCSPARVKRSIRKARAEKGRNNVTFWDIYKYLPRETRAYVPMYIAASLIMSNPDKFNLKPVEKGTPYAFDYVRLETVTPLKKIAELASISLSDLKDLNPEIRSSVIPPVKNGYMLRLPMGSRDHFFEGYEQLISEQGADAALNHKVAKGETMGRIAKKYGTTISRLKKANGIKGNSVKRGRVLEIPVSKYTSGMAREVAEVIGERQVQYGTRNTAPVLISSTTIPQGDDIGAVAIRTTQLAKERIDRNSKSATARKASAGSGKARTHRVRRGETLGSIASKYGVRISDLRRWNGIRGSKIISGRRLKVYGGKAVATQASTTSSAKTHKVRRGDTLGGIANKYGLSISRLKSINGLKSSNIRVGQRLKLSGSSSSSENSFHRVKRGDTLGNLARKYKTSLSQLRKWNKISGSRIKVGQRLRVG